MSARKTSGVTDRTPKSRRPGLARPVARKRLLIVDDHPMLRAGLVELINSQPDMEVCGEAANGGEALGEIQKCHPELVVTDITMPGRSGVEFLKDAHAINPDLPVLILSMHDEMLYAERVLHAGARGYIMKEASPEELLTAIRRVLAGEVYASAHLSIRLLDSFTGRPAPDSHAPMSKLSDRELEVFRLLGEGLPTEVIGRRLNLSAKTIATHRINIKAKLGIRTASELISCAAKWVSTEDPGG
jgi:DNA-binding NarL/FixJ family response regulator